MYRDKTCGELRLTDEGQSVKLAGWVQRSRKMGGMTFIDLRDRYGITQIVFNQEINPELCEAANALGREFVVQVTGKVTERTSKNKNIPTGEIEIIADGLKGTEQVEIPIGGEYCKAPKIGAAVANADVVVSMTHFKER